jgi:ABC-type uncharacterized transport system involved in gliding motility auxiliary subunit
MKRSRLPLLRVNIAVLVGIILGIMVLINYLSYKHHKRFDTTAIGKYSLSDQTLKVLKSLSDKLEMIMFDKPGTNERDKAEDLLTEYRYHSDQVSVRYIDPDQQPALATKYGVTRYGTLVLEFQGRQQQVENITEEAVTNAMLKLTKGKSKVIYFLTGHGEADIEDNTKAGYSLIGQALKGQNYEAKKLLLMREAKVPADCTLLVVASPKTALMSEEQQLIEDYLNAGGKAFFLLDSPMGDKPGVGLNEFLAKWGVEVGNDIIIDTMSRLFAGDYFMPVITLYSEHPITSGFKLASFFPLSRSVSPAEKTPDNITIQTLASTGSQNSWAESQIDGPYEYTEGKDKLGPVSVAVVAEIETKTKEAEKKGKATGEEKTEDEEKTAPTGRLVVFGDSDFANNTYLNLSGNRDLFLNVISWLAEEEDLISIRPKSDVPRTISLTGGQMQAVFYLSVVLLPALGLAIGVTVWLRRRRL